MMNGENYWSRFASDYSNRNLYVIGKDDMDMAENVLSKIRQLGSILELACGNGIYSEILAVNASRVVATDFSNQMVAVAGQRLRDFPNVVVEKADGFALPYGNGSFDTVFAGNLLHVIGRPEAILAEARRVLKKNGRLITLDWTLAGMGALHKAGMIFRYLRTYGKPPAGGKNFSLSQLERLFLREGFGVERSELIGSKSKFVMMIGRKTDES